MKDIIVFVVIIILSISAKAQIYSVPNPYVNINKTTDFGVLHEYIQINNLTSSPFPMRWVAQVGGCPTGWNLSISDPDSMYNNLANNDSAMFMLSDTNYYNKLIISVVHNGFVGACTVSFNIYPLSDSTDATNVGFNIYISQGSSTGVNSYLYKKNDVVYPNPSSGIFKIKKEFKKAFIYNAVGVLLKEEKTKEIDLSALTSGIYFLKLNDADGNVTTTKLIKN